MGWCSVVYALACHPPSKTIRSATLRDEKTVPIGVMAALPQELVAIENILENKREQVINDHKFVTGDFGNFFLVTTLSGIGKVKAAMTAQKLISTFYVKAIVFTGVAGAINTQYEIGDVIIADKAFQHDFGYLGKKFHLHKPGILPEIGPFQKEEPIMYELKANWPFVGKDSHSLQHIIASVSRKAKEFLTPVVTNGKNYQPKLFEEGTIATGDQFVVQEYKKADLKKLGADLVEMEGAAVAQVAYENRIPTILARAISDKADENSNIDYSAFFEVVAQNSAKLITTILRDEQFVSFFEK